MNQKKQRIIQESMKLFAEKGYHATSIQEIVKQSEVSKGAFYLYFHSKEELTIEIFDYYTSMVMGKVEEIQQQENKDGKTKLVEQLKMFFDLITNHKEYVIMQLRDNLQIGSKIDELVIKLNKQGFVWIQKSIKGIYGDIADPYIVDISIQLDGILQGYFKSIVLHNLQLDTGSLAHFVVDRLDDMIKGMVKSKATPQITLKELSYDFMKGNQLEGNINLLIEQLKGQINDSAIAVDHKTQLLEAAVIISEEAIKEQSNHIILKGMLTQLCAISSLQQTCKEIAQALAISLKELDIKKNEGDQ